MTRNLPLITFAIIFVAGMILAGMALVHPLGFTDSEIISWPANNSQADVQIMIDSNSVYYFDLKKNDKATYLH